MDTLRRAWQEGLEGQHIEELISGVFSDFAPYAGAEHQRLSLARQHGTQAISSVTAEESGDLICSVGHTSAGSTMFTTTGLLQVDASVKVPLPPPSRGPPGHEHIPLDHGQQSTVATPATTTAPLPTRFLSTTRGAQLFFGIPAVPRAELGGPCLGQLELESSMPAMWQGRVATGLRAGPFAARLSRAPTLLDIAGSQSAGNTLDETTGSLDRTPHSDMNSSGSGRGRAGLKEVVVYTLDTAVCVPVARMGGTADAAASGGAVALTVGLQHPFSRTLPVVGDTLVGVALQNDRHAAAAYEDGAVDALERGGARRSLAYPPCEHAFRLLVVQTLMSAQNSGGGGGGSSGLDSSGRRRGAASRLQNSSGSSAGGDLSASSARGLAGKPWYSLPTLVGCNLSLKHHLVRLSVASIFHDGEADVEAAAVVDVTQWVPRTPTLLKLGWNSTGRLALGITSLFYDALSLTLGVHAMPGEDMRFGLEIKV